MIKIEKDLSIIDASIFSLNEVIQERVSSFNGFFSDISQRLYGEKFAMSATFEKARKSESSFYKLYIDSLNGQTGTGKKKGEIVAFDIAYVKFSDKEEIPNLHFILHDQMEVWMIIKLLVSSGKLLMKIVSLLYQYLVINYQMS